MKPKRFLFFLSGFLFLGISLVGCEPDLEKKNFGCETQIDSLQKVHQLEMLGLKEKVDSLETMLNSSNVGYETKIDSLIRELGKSKSNHRIPRPEGDPIKIPKVN